MRKFFIVVFFSLFSASAFAEGASGVVSFFSDVVTFLDDGIYQWADSVLHRIAAHLVIWKLKTMVFFLEIYAAFADQLISSLNMQGVIQDLLGALDPKIAAFVGYLKIVEAMNMILSASVTRWIMDLFS